MAVIAGSNLFSNLSCPAAEECFDTLAEAAGTRIERIVSFGQSTPAGQWYDQLQDEWVLLVSGGAGILIEGEQEERRLAPGDWLLLPARCRHRVEWTSPGENTVWLAVHFAGGAS